MTLRNTTLRPICVMGTNQNCVLGSFQRWIKFSKTIVWLRVVRSHSNCLIWKTLTSSGDTADQYCSQGLLLMTKETGRSQWIMWKFQRYEREWMSDRYSLLFKTLPQQTQTSRSHLSPRFLAKIKYRKLRGNVYIQLQKSYVTLQRLYHNSQMMLWPWIWCHPQDVQQAQSMNRLEHPSVAYANWL